MPIVVQAMIMGIAQGLTEFLPISSSGHLILLPSLLGWDDPFINSLAFSVMLHLGTLVALLAYFWRDWIRLVPAGLAAIRDRSFAGDPDRKLAWLLAITTIPAIVAGLLLNDPIESTFRQPGLVAVMLLVGAAIIWIADRWGGTQRTIAGMSFRVAFGIGAAQAVALVPGISRSGVSIAAGRFAGLDRPAAARFSFLMATPIIAMAGAYETMKLVRGENGAAPELLPMVAGMVAALVSGLAAIHYLLRWLAGHSLDIFVVYRIVLAGIVVVWFLNP